MNKTTNIAERPCIRPNWHGWLHPHPFAEGMGSVMNLGGIRMQPNGAGLFSPDADAVAILSDWAAIGGDFFAVMPSGAIQPGTHGP